MTTPHTTDSSEYASFLDKLYEIFMFDQADLDFGIYRIMNVRRDEIKTFLIKDLLPHVQTIISASVNANRSTYTSLIDAADKKQKADQARFLRERMSTLDEQQLQRDVFTHLHTFFARYYDKGDFISLRRINKDAYAIPYSGEEVKLHWANADQYYIKSSEYFRDYAFTLGDGRRVHFKLVDADTEANNNKASASQERRFMLCGDAPVQQSADDNTLTIAFTYQVHADKQDKLNDDTLRRVETQLNSTWYNSLFTLDKNGKSILANRLNDYTKRNTFDYFIHKNLGEFLRRELDFYVKNEMIRLDDGNDASNTGADIELSVALTRIRAFRSVGHKIIAFLAQLEDFQKKLWLKKKFVVETNYCVTVDRVPEPLYDAIIANDAQVDEWVKLFAIDELRGDMLKATYSRPLTHAFLAENPFLVVDTKFFDQAFKDALLASFTNIDEACDGLLIHSENFQALNLLQARYREQVKCIYIDPPYNAKSSEIVYKNNYKHSSWLSFMQDRCLVASQLLSEQSVFVTAIDEVENLRLGLMYEYLFPNRENAIISIVHNPTGQQGKNFSYTHEFAHFLIPSGIDCIGLENRNDLQRESTADIRPLRNVSSGVNHYRESAANCFYPIYVKNGRIVGFGDVSDIDYHPSGINITRQDGIIEIYPIDANGRESKWVFARNTVESILSELKAEYNTKKGTWDIIRTKSRFRYKSLWLDSRYSANSWGSVVLNNILPNNIFTFPKSIHTVQDCIDAGLNNYTQGYILDYFAGSGTTGHAVINLNRSDNGQRKYILVEMGEYFNTVTKPRIQKVVYSADWKNGKPEGRVGSSHMFKYMRLESYEDTLNNVRMHRSPAQTSMLDDHAHLREEYVLGYMLDVESRGSASLLNETAFTCPFDYVLDVAKSGSVAESVPTRVDMVETFNYLIGMRVQRVHAVAHLRMVAGTTPDGKRTLVVWRDDALLRNEKHLWDTLTGTELGKQMGDDYDVVYVNGDTALASHLPATCQVRAIDTEFHARMFADTAY